MSDRQNLELWCVDLAAAAPALQAVEARTPRLSAADETRASAFSDTGVRTEWRAAHIALRLVIERAAGARWRGAAFARRERGKPCLEGVPIDFSLSHAPGLALIGIARGGLIGVDVERTRAVRIDTARRASIREAGSGLCAARLPSEGDAGFLQAWVRLEAYAKAEGCGIGRLLTRLGIFGAGARAPETVLQARERAAALLADGAVASVCDLQLGSGIYAAVACGGGAPTPVRWLPTSSESLEKLII